MIKKLYRSKTDRHIAGVCGGIGQFFGIDATVIRLIWVVLLLFTGILPMTLIYLICWFMIPEI